MNASLGQVVYSKAGRDSGKAFIIVALFDENNVLIADGDLRRIEKPKKKKLKHLELTENVIGSLSEKLENSQRVGNSEIRKMLADFSNNDARTVLQ